MAAKPRKTRTPWPEGADAYAESSAFAGGTDEEIARALGVSKTTLSRHVGPSMAKKRAQRQLALRAAQQKFALKGQPALLIWLGKQPVEKGGLGQVDEMTLARDINLADKTDEQLEALSRGKAKLALVKEGGGGA